MNDRGLPPSPETDWRSLHFHFNRWGRSAEWPAGHRLSRSFFRGALVDFTFWFFFKGRGTLIDHRQGTTIPIQPGTCLCFGPGFDLEARQDSPDLLGNTYFHFDILRDSKPLAPKVWPEVPFATLVGDLDFFDTNCQRVLTFLNQSKLPGFENEHSGLLAAEFLLKGLLVDLCQKPVSSSTDTLVQHHEKALSSALAALHAEPGRFRSVRDLAKISGYSPSHFRAICLQVLGEKPSDILIKARINQARRLLQHSELAVGMIAETLGYENIYYFSRQFRAITGTTASAYRTQSREKSWVSSGPKSPDQ